MSLYHIDFFLANSTNTKTNNIPTINKSKKYRNFKTTNNNHNNTRALHHNSRDNSQSNSNNSNFYFNFNCKFLYISFCRTFFNHSFYNISIQTTI